MNDEDIIAEDFSEQPIEGQNEKSSQAMRTITEVSAALDVPQHVLRFWESRFRHVKPLKRAGGRRYYRTVDVAILKRIRELLYNEGYTIRGVQKLIQEQGLRRFIGVQNSGGLTLGAPLTPNQAPAKPDNVTAADDLTTTATAQAKFSTDKAIMPKSLAKIPSRLVVPASLDPTTLNNTANDSHGDDVTLPSTASPDPAADQQQQDELNQAGLILIDCLTTRLQNLRKLCQDLLAPNA